MHKRVLLLALLSALSASARVGDVLKTIPCPGPMPTGLACDGKALWVADAFTDKLYRIDPRTG